MNAHTTLMLADSDGISILWWHSASSSGCVPLSSAPITRHSPGCASARSASGENRSTESAVSSTATRVCCRACSSAATGRNASGSACRWIFTRGAFISE